MCFERSKANPPPQSESSDVRICEQIFTRGEHCPIEPTNPIIERGGI